MSGPALSLRQALEARAPESQRAEILAVADSFAPELGRYAELIASPGGAAFGFMTRGEGAAFTARVAATLKELGLPAAASEHHAALASWFEHIRGFAKFEWHRDGSAALAPMAAVYFRRRPQIESALSRLAALGVVESVRERLRELAAILEKPTVHFVSAAFLRGVEPQHKLYFSQLVIDERKPAIEDRLRRVFDLLGLGDLRERWLPVHRRALASPVETTLYVSFNFTAGQLVPTVKVDYPGLFPTQVAAFGGAEPQGRDEIAAEASSVSAAMGADHLAYLGVRFEAGQWPPRLKYYADRHGEPAQGAA